MSQNCNDIIEPRETDEQRAAQKSAWDAKAELSDIPNKLPADGGNAAILGGKSASEFLQGVGGLTSGSLLEYALTLSASGWLVAGPNVTDTPNPGKTFLSRCGIITDTLNLLPAKQGLTLCLLIITTRKSGLAGTMYQITAMPQAWEPTRRQSWRRWKQGSQRSKEVRNG